jgi:hypothetical protein
MEDAAVQKAMAKAITAISQGLAGRSIGVEIGMDSLIPESFPG